MLYQIEISENDKANQKPNTVILRPQLPIGEIAYWQHRINDLSENGFFGEEKVRATVQVAK
jgi:hypothetical protein